MDAEQATSKPPWYRALHWQIMIAMAVAVVVALALHSDASLSAEDLAESDASGAYFNASLYFFRACDFLGQLFIRSLKMIIVPLVFASVIVGISSIETKSLGRIGGKTLGFYLMTTGLAVLAGLVAVNVVRPGVGVGLEAAEAPTLRPDSLPDILMKIVPTNPFASLAETFDLLSVIFFGIVFGLAIAIVGDEAAPVRRFFEGVNAVMMKITDWVMALAPLGVFALLVQVISSIGLESMKQVAAYMGTVAGALLFHALITLPLLLLLLARLNPRHAFRNMGPALLTAFSTASSSATLPMTMDCATDRAGVDSKVSSFVLPIGATVNMDGTALYEAVAVIFIAQAYGIELTMAQQVIVFLTATLAAIGAAGVPSAGLVTMIIVLEAVGLPLEGIGLLVAVDRVLDMMRTSVNVWGDSVCAMVIAAREKMLDVARFST